MRKPSIILAFLILGIIPVFAQGEECAFTLREAENLYSQGRIENIPEMLEDCIQRGFSSEDRLAAYKLIILCSLYNDEQEQAEDQMLDFLKKYPEYELTPTDPEEFGYLFRNYRTRPVFDYGLFVGLNYSHGSLVEPYSLLPNLSDDELRFRPDNFGLGAGLILNFYITNTIQVTITPMYAQKKIRLDHYDDVVLGIYHIEHFESQSYIDIPLSVTYDFDLGRFKPYLRAGGQLGYLFEAKTSTTTRYLQDGNVLYENSGPDVDVHAAGNRNKFNYGILGGAGVKLKITKGYFYLDARYTVGLNLQNTGNRYEVDELTWKYQYVDPDFRMNTILVGIGFVRSFYNPKRIE
jgi:hypothetical protein